MARLDQIADAENHPHFSQDAISIESINGVSVRRHA